MNVWLISDSHFNHQNIKTYCDRPDDFTERIIANWQRLVKPEDTIIHLGDVMIGKKSLGMEQLRSLTGRKILIRGNHDRQHSNTWWMEHGFDFACDGLMFRHCWLSHEPVTYLPDGALVNIHGHLHNIWHGFRPDRGAELTHLMYPWQRLFAVEYTKYMPVEFDKFVSQPDKYQARGRIIMTTCHNKSI